VLVLVESERQAEIWRRAVRQAACCEDREPLAGAIALFNEQENPWRWAWRDLTTGAQLRLATRFGSQTPYALSEEVLAHLVAVQGLMESCSRIDELPGARLGEQVSQVKKAKRQSRSSVTSLTPSPRQRELLTRLSQTPYLTGDELAAVLPRILDGEPLASASVERLLRELARQHLAERELVTQDHLAVWRWHLTEKGLRQVAAMHDLSLLHLKRLATQNRFMMQRQGKHQAGVYSVIAAFHRAAQATRGAITVVWWDCGRGAERSYHYHGMLRNLRPDAELELVLRREGEGVSQHLCLWIEYDTGTMNRRDLERKMTSYRDYWNSREWAVEGLAALPRLLFIVPEHGQEERVRRACFDILSGVRLRVLVTTAAHLEAATPYGRIWRPILEGKRGECDRTERRVLWE
jgi:hypothetical protein